ncbi:unnamed protein product [Ostreobium quekettii]|uniref:Protein kinase domain-containing protein n=1 Tax=Ostreobium quekettii TaxID=121088 RepID=A0A8S1J939_9CHLO|nr:unnamed protein product [Ostreobium quekettii]
MESYVTGSVRGTLGYMAPEVAILLYDPSVKISVKVDIYSLGVVMWEMVERKKIKLEAASFSGQEPSTDMDESWSPGSRFTFTNPCPGPLKDLILKCVEMQPKERPQAGEVCQEIQRIQRMFSAGQEANT